MQTDWFLKGLKHTLLSDLHNRYSPRFFDQVGHETMYASSGNKHYFTKSCHRQTCQNYEQSRQKLGDFEL